MSSDVLQTTKKVLRALLISTPSDGVPLIRLLRDYEDSEGRLLPFKELGFKSAIGFLYSIPDTLYIQQRYGQPNVFSIAAEENEHISKLVAEQQRQKPRKRRFLQTPNRNASSFNPFGGRRAQTVQPVFQQSFNKYFRNDHRNGVRDSRSSQNLWPNQTQQYHNNTSKSNYKGEEYSSRLHSRLTQSIEPNKELNASPSNWNADTKAGPSQSHQYRSSVEKDIVNRTQQDERTESNILAHVSRVNDEISENRCAGRDYENLSDDNINHESPAMNANSNFVDQNTNVVCSVNQPDDVGEVVETMVKIKLADLGSDPNHVINQHDKNDGCHDDKISKVEHIQNDDVGFSDSHSETSNSNDNLDGSDDAFPNFLDEDFLKLQIADDYALHDASYETIEFHNIFHGNANPKITITGVANPYKFWFRMDKYSPEYMALMDAMESFYNSISHAKEAVIAEKFLKMGQLCAVNYEWKWHRGTIVNISGVELAIYLIDSGVIVEVFSTCVRFLRKEFLKLPAQAVRGSLDFVKPERGVWTHDPITEFWKLAKDKLFNTIITGFRTKERIVYMQLINRADNSDVRNAMVEKKLALPLSRSVNEFSHRFYNEQYPSFEMLEKNEYPSYEDMEFMMAKGFDYYRYEARIFIPEMIGYLPPSI